MKIKHTLIVLFLFVYSVAFGQQSKNMCAQVDVNQREQISQLRAENDDLKKQLDFIEKKIEHEEKVVDDLKGEITFWFSFVTIVVTILSIGVPLYNMIEIKKKQSEVEDKQEEVKAELEKQRNLTIDLQTLAESAKEQAEQAGQAAYDAKAIQFFVLALKEPNPENALVLYGKLIDKYGSFYGIAEAYSNRAECYRKLAEIEPDKDKREGYIKQAEDDEREVEKLKQKGK
ncbi:MAG: hypothetical protein J6M59_12790 [Bacteroidaceae bacterium]|nr:hypothetical protein [Bacteroidaceae bacterium]